MMREGACRAFRWLKTRIRVRVRIGVRMMRWVACVKVGVQVRIMRSGG